jgi:hypothetical protein
MTFRGADMKKWQSAANIIVAIALSLLGSLSMGFGSDGEFDRVKIQSQRLRSIGASGQLDQFGNGLPEELADFKTALRDWIESELPSSRSGFESSLPSLQSRMTEELRNADVLEPEGQDEDNFVFGFVSNLEVLQPEGFPEVLVITAGVSVPCGHDDSVYAYSFAQGTRQRLLESYDTGTHGRSVSEIKFSGPDEKGNRLMFISRYGVQCASCWNGLSYKIFRLGGDSQHVSNILEGSIGLYICADYHVKLEPDQFLMELRGRSIDSGILIRTHVQNYMLDKRGAHRVEPFALQAQDFVDEWLSRPWDEMAQTSQSQGRQKLEHWHQILHADYVSGEYDFVQQCTAKPEQTQVAVDLNYLVGKELPEPLTVYFVVQEERKNSFKMLDISFTRQDGCPGETYAKPDSPSLFEPDKKNHTE